MRKSSTAAISGLLLCLPSLGLAQTPAPPPASAPAGAVERDIKCFVVAAALATSNDNSVRGVALISSMYFMGRIDTQAIAAAEVNRRIQSAVETLEDEAMQAELTACSQTMREAGNKYRVVGQQLRTRRPAT